MGTDADLTRRIGLTLALLLVVDLLFVVALAYLLSPWLAPLRDAVVGSVSASVPGTSAAAVWWTAVIGIALVAFVWAQLRYTRDQTLAGVDARETTPESHPGLHERVGRLAQLADVSPPTVAVVDSPVPNSFAVGTLRDATIVVSEGLLATLDDDELDAVLAHELAHVTNRDATVMTLAGFLPALTNAEFDLRDAFAPGGRAGGVVLAGVGSLALLGLGSAVVEAPPGSPAFLGGLVLLAALTVVLGGVVLGVVTAPVVYLGRSLSRYREYAADRAGARLTGDPAALASALRKLDDEAAPAPSDDKRAAYGGVRELCFLPYGFEDDAERSKFYVETRSHPPTAARIDRLKDVAAER